MSGYNAYLKTQNATTTQNSRDTEYRLLGQVTAGLIEAENDAGNLKRRMDVLVWNRQVWSVFRMDLTHPENGLPKGLRDQLVDLSNWIERETFRILQQPALSLDGLIDVNKNIMDGLKDQSAIAGGMIDPVNLSNETNNFASNA